MSWNLIQLKLKKKDVYCQFKIFNDPTTYKTSTVKGDKGFNFKFVKQFNFVATEQVRWSLSK